MSQAQGESPINLYTNWFSWLEKNANKLFTQGFRLYLFQLALHWHAKENRQKCGYANSSLFLEKLKLLMVQYQIIPNIQRHPFSLVASNLLDDPISCRLYIISIFLSTNLFIKTCQDCYKKLAVSDYWGEQHQINH